MLGEARTVRLYASQAEEKQFIRYRRMTTDLALCAGKIPYRVIIQLAQKAVVPYQR